MTDSTQSPVTGPRETWPDEHAMDRAAAMTDSFVLLREEQASRKHELPAPADFHRLPLSWYKCKSKEIKEHHLRYRVHTYHNGAPICRLLTHG